MPEIKYILILLEYLKFQQQNDLKIANKLLPETENHTIFLSLTLALEIVKSRKRERVENFQKVIVVLGIQNSNNANL